MERSILAEPMTAMPALPIKRDHREQDLRSDAT